MVKPLFEHRLRVTPEKPGVYLMKDVQDNVIYVGKASVLKNRLRSYFGAPSGLATKIRHMMEQVSDFEFIVTDTESEALILENTLIKRYQPHYNARLKDDKTYPFLKIDLNEEFPKVYITRQVANDGARYFGPFASAGSVRHTMDLIKKPASVDDCRWSPRPRGYSMTAGLTATQFLEQSQSPEHPPASSQGLLRWPATIGRARRVLPGTGLDPTPGSVQYLPTGYPRSAS